MSSYEKLAAWYDTLTDDVDYESLYEYLNVIAKRRGVQPRRVLDMACGTGTLTQMFAEHGLRTYGVDLSPGMIEVARKKYAGQENAPEFSVGDMSTYVMEQPVDLMVCMLDSFNYMRSPEQGRAALRCFADSVAEGGLLIFDVRPPEQLKDFDGQMFMDETEDVVCIWRTEFDYEENQCFYGMDIFVREGELWKREREEHLEYAFELSWLEQELEAAGFCDISFYGERTFLPPQPDEERVFIAARKKENT